MIGYLRFPAAGVQIEITVGIKQDKMPVEDLSRDLIYLNAPGLTDQILPPSPFIVIHLGQL